MSLRSGLASITGSASRAARRVLGGVLSDPEEEENDDSSDKDDGSEQDDDASDAYLPLSAVTPAVDVKADSDTTHVAVSAVKTEVVPLSEGTETPTPLGGVSAFTPSAAKSFFSTPRPTESKYDRDSVSKVSGKLDFSEKMLKRLQRVERFRKRQENYLRHKKSKVCLKNKKNLGSLMWVLMVVHLLVFGSEKVVPLVVSSKQSSSKYGSVQPGDGVSSVAGLSLSVATTAADRC